MVNFDKRETAANGFKPIVVQIGIVNSCSCPAGARGRTRSCKHQDAVAAIYAGTDSTERGES